MRQTRKWVAIAGAALLLPGAWGCRNANVLSTKQEVQIGREVSAEIEKQFRVDKATQDAERVRRIGERLLMHAEPRPNVPYSFKVIDARDINAFAFPGGPMYVLRGLLDLVGDDDDALACVMAHEIGHINARHSAKHISQQMLASLGLVFVRDRRAQDIGVVLTNLMSLGYSREDEYESDRRGLAYAYKAGFDPKGMVRFFELLQSLEKSAGGPPEFLRTHPLTNNRIRRAEQIIAARDYKFGN